MYILFCSIDNRKMAMPRSGLDSWSGDATRSQGFAPEETRVDVTIGDENAADNANTVARKERPIWMMESTVVSNDKSQVKFLNINLLSSFIIVLQLYCSSLLRF